MFNRFGKGLYLSLVFIAGVLVGEINTYNLITYTDLLVEHKKVKEPELPQKPPHLKKAKPLFRSLA